MNILDLLKKDHRKVSSLFKDIEKTDSAQEKSSIFHQLKSELDLHAKFEETQFYTLLKNEETTHDITLESYEEHSLIKQLLKELDVMSADRDEWTAKLTVLKEIIEHHVDEEESDLFPKAKKVLTKEQLVELGEKYEMQKGKVLVKR